LALFKGRFNNEKTLTTLAACFYGFRLLFIHREAAVGEAADVADGGEGF
jgi:hypothetical protein